LKRKHHGSPWLQDLRQRPDGVDLTFATRIGASRVATMPLLAANRKDRGSKSIDGIAVTALHA
jgi:hypothetical protein